ncbi:MAG: FAD binding domain-containing protein [Vulcanimicrobiaceae bacterium]
MLRLPSFTFEPAHSVSHAVELLALHGADAVPVSGGTDLYANMKMGLLAPKVLVGLRSIKALRAMTYDEENGLCIGALCSLNDVAANESVLTHYPALAYAASLVATPEIRNMGSIGGNLLLDTRCNYFNQHADWRKALGYCLKRGGDICRVAEHSTTCLAVNSSDTAPVLHSFDASIHLAGPTGERIVPIGAFYRNDGRNAIAKLPSEIVTKISIPPPGPLTRSSYRKLRLRNSFDFPLLGIAVMVRLDEAGICRKANIVLNAVAPRPVDVPEAAQRLIDTRLDEDAISEAAEIVFKIGKPLDNTSTSLLYRKRMLRVFARRALEDVCHA